MTYPHGSWCYKLKNKAKALEVVKRAVCNGAKIHDDIGNVITNPVSEPKIDVKRLKIDRSYWDRVAPANAEQYVPETNDCYETWIKYEGSDKYIVCSAVLITDWTKVNYTYPDELLIKRPISTTQSALVSTKSLRSVPTGVYYTGNCDDVPDESPVVTLLNNDKLNTQTVVTFLGNCYTRTTDFFTFWDNWYPVNHTNIEWKGMEHGLPPIGTVCMVQHEKINNNKLTRVEILKHHPETNACAFFWIDAPKHQPNLFWSSKFHPINTERQKWIDEAVVVSATPEKELGKVYDAIKSGLLAIPK